MRLSDMDKAERSLLLYFETCAVDRGGLVDLRRMNDEDKGIKDQWNMDEFVLFGRVRFADVKNYGTHWCELSNEAWEIAHLERMARHIRMNNKRRWLRTEEVKAP